jgi:hypothetical protein
MLAVSGILARAPAKAEVEIAASGGVITAIATVEAIDVTNRLLTVACRKATPRSRSTSSRSNRRRGRQNGTPLVARR